jgi:hypothetical protein
MKLHIFLYENQYTNSYLQFQNIKGLGVTNQNFKPSYSSFSMPLVGIIT